MPLRAVQPGAVAKRLKLFMFGPAGVGKTTCAIQFPNSYIIDCERGSENYDDLITASGSAVFQTTNMEEIVREVYALATERHEYRTLVIDPITTAYAELLDKCENEVGSAHGRHYGEANKTMKRLANLLMQLDMNVVITAHAKDVLGANMAKLDTTFDGWKRLEYLFDLVVELTKQGKKRVGKVRKTRIKTFPDGDSFEWNYQAMADRYGRAVVERAAEPVAKPSDGDAPDAAEAFRIQLRELFESRDFTPEEMKTAAAAIAKGYGVAAVTDLNEQQRKQSLAAVAAGRADKFRAEPAGV